MQQNRGWPLNSKGGRDWDHYFQSRYGNRPLLAAIAATAHRAGNALLEIDADSAPAPHRRASRPS